MAAVATAAANVRAMRLKCALLGFGRVLTPRPLLTRARPSRFSLRDGQLPLHAGGGMAGNGALIGDLPGLQRRGQRSGLAGLDQLALLPGDREVVRKLALVDELERDAAVPDLRLGQREL